MGYRLVIISWAITIIVYSVYTPAKLRILSEYANIQAEKTDAEDAKSF